SCSFKIAMICSSLNLLRFIFVRLLYVGLYSKSVTFQGNTSGCPKDWRRVPTRYDRCPHVFRSIVCAHCHSLVQVMGLSLMK
ncbi:hypothetical protein, partial [Sphingobium sp. MP9-4]|uniref:hypothetical protein n=1 Tax=Sphingobium sp. MP9-4 TaxID=1761936 RepID=UPI0019CFDECE